MAGKYPMGIMRIYTAMVERVKIFHDCPSLKLYRSRLLQSRAQEDNSVSISWLGTAGVLVLDGKTGILIDPYVSRFGFFKIAMGLHLQPNKALVKSWTAHLGKGRVGAVVVSHSHFDHCIDAPYFAMETGALLVGPKAPLNRPRGISGGGAPQSGETGSDHQLESIYSQVC